MSEELKPCPRCGATRGLYVLYDEDNMEWFVFCDGCKTSLHNEYNDTREDAVRIWNRCAELTCTIDYDAVHQDYVCSSCGERYEYDMYAAVNDDDWTVITSMCYCPHCGARVVE